MKDDQRLEIIRRQAEGMRAMSKEDMAKRQLESADQAFNALVPRDALSAAQGAANFWSGALDEAEARREEELKAAERRSLFALLPVKRWSSRYYRNRFYWLRKVTQRRLDGEWKALEADN